MQGITEQPPSKRVKRDVVAEQEAASRRLGEQLEEHDQSRAAVQEKLRDFCNKLREHINKLEEEVNSTLEEKYTKEDDRLQETLSKLRVADTTDAEEEAETWALIDKANAELLVVQSYALAKQKNAGGADNAELPSTYKLVVKKRVREDLVSARRPTGLKVESVAPGVVTLAFTSLSVTEERAIRENGLEGEVTYRALLGRKGAEADGAGAGKEYTLGRGEEEDAGTFSFLPGALEPEAEYEVRVKVVCGGSESEWSDAAEFATGGYSECCLWSADPNHKDYAIDRRTPRVVTKAKGANFGRLAVGSAALPAGRTTSWGVRVLSSRNGRGHGIYVGVKSAANDNDNQVYLFGCYDSALYRGLPHRYYNRGREYGVRRSKGKYVREGGSVGVVFDAARGEVSFAVDGVSLGVAFEGLPPNEPLVPCVFLENEGDSVRLEAWELRESVAGSVHVPAAVTASSVTHNAVTLSWGGSGRGTAYQIEVDGRRTWDASRACTFTKEGLLPETTYRFRVRAVKGRSVSEWSEVVAVTTKAEAEAEEEVEVGEAEEGEASEEKVEVEADEPVHQEDSIPEPALYPNENKARAVVPNNFAIPQEFNMNLPQSFIYPPNIPPNFCRGMNMFGNVGVQGQGCFGGCFYPGQFPYPMAQNINYACPRPMFV